MTSSTTNILFLALLLVYSSRAVSGSWKPMLDPKPGTALVNVLENSQSEIKLKLSLPGFYLEEKIIQGKTYYIPALGNTYPMLRKGDPDVPKFTATLEIPASGDYQPSIVSAKYQDYQTYPIAPSAGNISRSAIQTTPEFSGIYQQDEFYPGILIGSSTPYIIRNSRNQSFQVYPFQYNPVTGILRVYYEIEFSITRSSEAGINTLKGNELRKDGIDIVHPALTEVKSGNLKSGILPAEIGRMLIICPEEYKSALKPFISWKNQCGIATELADASQFTNPDQIKQFVEEYYNTTGNLTYLLLVGDADQVPPYTCALGASDNYYSYLEGDDHYPDILVGRFSANSVQDVEVQVAKTLKYEQNPGTDTQWLSKATGIASTMGPGDDGETDFEHVRNLLTDLKKFSYNSISEFYDGSQGGSDADDNPSTQSEMNDFNSGTGIILYTGHGSTSTWATGRITRTVINGINNPDKFPFIWSTACETGNFAGSTCLAEAWMRATNANHEPLGSVAALMASGSQSSNPPMEAQDEMVNQLINASQENTARTFGGLSVSGMYKMNDIYGESGYCITDTWILFGDPSLQVRTSIPSALKVWHNEWIGKGRTEFSLKTNTTSGIACISENGIILGTAKITDGHAVILLSSPVEGAKVLLTVTSFNHLPYQAEIGVTDVPSAPADCFPANHSKRIAIQTEFAWNSGTGGIPDHYVFYLGTDNPPTNLINGISLDNLSYIPNILLNYETKYFWRVIAVNEAGISESKVFDFETIQGPDEDFEHVMLSPQKWVSEGNTGWTVDHNVPFHGLKSCRSGNVLKGNYSALQYPCEVQYCDFVGFWYKTSAESGSKLQFLIDASVRGEWEGNNEWSYVSFDIEPGTHTIEWRFINNSDSLSLVDAAWIDDINLPLHQEPLLEAGTDQAVCEGADFVPASEAHNYNSILWTSDGDGTFNDNNLIQPVYTPGPDDLKRGEVQLTMNLKGFNGCPEKFSTVTIYPAAKPIVNLPSDTLSASNTPLVLDASSVQADSWLWLPGNETSRTITVDTMGLDRGSRTILLQVTNHEGCTTEKEIRVHFSSPSEKQAILVYPNPCHNNFNIEPEGGVLMLEYVKLYNSTGELVWQQNGNIEIISHRNFKLPSLLPGTYFLHTGSNAGDTVKTLVIH